jgi:hypothetical protein
MPAEDLSELEIQLHRFNKLIAEVMRGSITRNSFLPWEFEILLDMDHCRFESRRRLDILRQYQRAVAKQMERGPGPPMKLSRFLEIRASRRLVKTQPDADSDDSHPLLTHPAA